eukprot:94476-Amphidinium_carterae.1
MTLKARCHPLLYQELPTTRYASQGQESNLQYNFKAFESHSIMSSELSLIHISEPTRPRLI